MTLDEAIEHAEERARGNDQCAKDHAQLSDWLRELRRARMEIDLLKTLRNGFRADAQKYKSENAKLRELLALATDMSRDYDGDRRALRRLARDMFGQLLNAYDWKELDDFADRMRELGVEAE